MISDSFDARSLANMEVALRQACERLSKGEDDHERRKFIATKLLECAQRGRTTLGDLTAAGRSALVELQVIYSGATSMDSDPPERVAAR